MDSMTLDKFTECLTRAAKAAGANGAILQKKLILDKYLIVDDAGIAVDPDSIDVMLMPAAPADEAAIATESASVQKQIKREVAASLATVPRITGGTLGTEAWESAKVYGRIKAFSGNHEKAYKFGAWCLAAMGHKKSADFCARNGIVLTKGHTEGVNSAGGFLVPDQFENELIVLREQYGVFRRNAKIYPMTGDTLRIPRKNAGLTAYFSGEAAAGTESTMTFDSVQLVAKKLIALTTVSNELLEDSVINIADDVATEMAYQFAYKEDDAGFNGDGTSTYGGIVGLGSALTDSTYQVSASAGSTKAAVTAAEIGAALAYLPNWAAARSNVKIYCNKGAYHSIFERLTLAAGGVTANEVANGVAPRYFGYPIEFSQAIATPADGGSATVCYIGDLAQACYLGDRRSSTIAFSDSALNAFEQDERVVRGTQRFDIICANVGSSSAYGAMVKFTL